MKKKILTASAFHAEKLSDEAIFIQLTSNMNAL
jgi:hypothetical protein